MMSARSSHMYLCMSRIYGCNNMLIYSWTRELSLAPLRLLHSEAVWSVVNGRQVAIARRGEYPGGVHLHLPRASGQFHEATQIRTRLRPHEETQCLASALLRNVCKLLTTLLLGEVRRPGHINGTCLLFHIVAAALEWWSDWSTCPWGAIFIAHGGNSGKYGD